MILDDFASLLNAAGIATCASTLFKSVMPGTPDEVIALYQSAGGPLVRGMSAGPGTALAERPHVQVLVRSTHPASAYKLAQDVYNHMDARGSQTINGVLYHAIFALQAPFPIGVDETGRYLYSLNFEVVRDVATSS